MEMRLDYKKLIAALPVAVMLLGATACSSDKEAEEPVVENNEGISLSIPLGGTRADNGMQNLPGLTDLYIATYTAAGEKVEDIVVAGEIAKGTDGKTIEATIVENDKFGAILTAYLPYKSVDGRKNYKEIIETNNQGLKFVAYYLPCLGNFALGSDALTTQTLEGGATKTVFKMPATLAEVSTTVTAAYTLSYPGSGSTDTPAVWQPASDMEVPMSGVLDITAALKAYNPVLWNKHNPMFLNNDPLVLIRAMAKVTVKAKVNKDQTAIESFPISVSFLTKTKGALMPDITKLVKYNNGINVKVNGVTEAGAADDYVTEIAGKNIGTDDLPVYEFYTFEKTLTSGSYGRNLIKATWPSHGTQTFEFKNYAGSQDAAEWQGILRNHSYVFTIIKSADGKVEIAVTLKPWEAFDEDVKI